MKSIEAIISSLRVAMTDARQNESHFESWMILNEAICDAIDALAEQKSGIKQVIELYDSPDQPAQRKPLTDDELQLIANKFRANTNTGHSFYAIARAIEAAHGIKGDA